MEQGRERRTFTRRDESAMAAVIRRLPQLIGEAGTDRPARLHGDLWSGNVMWTRVPSRDTGTVEAVLIDPAAHAGHREADLAMLALFGAPHLGEMLRGYQDVHPLTPDWQDRIPLHQLYPVAVHAVLFGGGYIDQTRALMAILLG
jgi:fructosamine-3-kinase